jgi:UDP-2-acetamido-3-amino-2,3-dideoxy-glucuronate N-acetyltransferase
VRVGRSFIGQQVIFDCDYPQNIEIGHGSVIAMRSIILAHYVKPHGNTHIYETGKVKIGDNAFIGANCIITKPVTIGDNVIVGAGSIITKDIPSNEIWAGVPARFLKKFS